MEKIKLNNEKRIAVIYSVDDLFAYVVLLCYQGKSYYISDADKPEKFGNMDEVRAVCRKHKADEAYLALSNSYQEVDITTDHPLDPIAQFDYHKIPL